jgi:PAS domain S-box-containing protein
MTPSVPGWGWAPDSTVGPALARLAATDLVGVVTGEGDRVVEANDYFCNLVGVSLAEVHAGDVDWRRMTPQEWAFADDAAMAEATRTGIISAYEKEYQRPDGRRVPVLLGGAIIDPGPPPRWISLLVDLSAQKAAEAAELVARAAAERAMARQVLLARLTTALAGVADVTGVAESVVRSALPALDATASAVWLAEPPDRLRLLTATGLPAEALEADGLGSTGDVGISGEVLRTGEPVVLASAAERAGRYPELAGLPLPDAWVSLPLLRDGIAVGVIAFGWAWPRDFAADDLEVLTAIAVLCGAALDRARLYEVQREAEQARDRLVFLAEATALLAALPDFPGLFARLARHAVPVLADTCVLHVLDGRGARQVAAASQDLRLQQLLDDRDGTVVSAADVLGRAVRTGRPAAREMTTADAVALLGPAAAELLGGGAEVMVLPLAARARVLGVLCLVRPVSDPRSTPEIERLALDFAGRAALAVDNAQLFAQRSYVAAKLQESLLPAQLPELPGLELAAKYVAAEQLAEVGGDFYDVFPVDEDAGQWAVVIGDVAGRGVDAAGVTGLARHTLRAVAGDLAPAAALRRLNEVLRAAAETDRFATVALLRLDLPADEGSPDGTPSSDVTGSFSSAGHCLPLLLREGGELEVLEAPGTLLGVLDTVRLSETRVRLAPGDLLLLYTDGVVEARGLDGLFGEERLAELVADCAGWPADAVVERIVDAVARYRTSAAADDMAVLALRVRRRRPSPTGLLLELRLPLTPAAAGAARRALARPAGGSGEQLSEELLADVRLIATELVTNAVRHGATGQGDAWVDLRVLARTDGVRLEVTHPGASFTPPDRIPAPGPTDERGRGLLVVQELSRAWGSLSPQPGVTGVWCEVPSPAPYPALHPAPGGRTPADRAGQPSAGTRLRAAPLPESPPRGMAGPPVYALAAVARLTGLSAATVTGWSRRYGLVVGHSSPGGHLLFTRDNLAALHLITELIAGGSSEADAHRRLALRLQQGQPLNPSTVEASERVLLLADRDPYAAHLAEHLLRTAGYRLTLATTVADARLAAEQPPDLAIVDLMISGGRGLDLIRELRQRGGTPVLALSSLQVADEALTAGADAFLRKPLQPLTLVAAVHDLLRTSAFLRTAREPE